jgi:hypothetical protein
MLWGNIGLAVLVAIVGYNYYQFAGRKRPFWALLPYQLVTSTPLGRQAPDGLFEQGLHFAEVLIRIRMIRIGHQLSQRALRLL